jgi:hypothetical protein
VTQRKPGAVDRNCQRFKPVVAARIIAQPNLRGRCLGTHGDAIPIAKSLGLYRERPGREIFGIVRLAWPGRSRYGDLQ